MPRDERAAQARWYRFLRRLIRRPVCALMGFSFEAPKDLPEPFILLSNHNTDLDPLLVGLSVSAQLYFVASEHVFRKGLWSRLLEKIFAPIPRTKGAADAGAALEILRRVRKGQNVCIFAEGNRSYNGVTGPVLPATGKLVKNARATLVTYRFEGGYMVSPRWGKSLRKGPMSGHITGVYSPEELQGMSPGQINALIARDIHEDAAARQAEEQLSYTGRDLAEYLEVALYACPRCERIGTLKSRGDVFACDCGLSVTYTEKGTFAGSDAPFQNVRDWDEWQSGFMARFAESVSEGPAFFDEGAILSEIDQGHRAAIVERGRLALSREAMTVEGRVFPISDISGMALIGKAKLVFTTNGGRHFEIKLPPAKCGRKYFALYQLLKN